MNSANERGPQLLVDRKPLIRYRPATSRATPIAHSHPRRSASGRRNVSTCAANIPNSTVAIGWQRADDALRIPGLRLGVIVAAQHHAIDMVSDVAFDTEVAGAKARNGDEHHQRPIAGEQASRPGEPAAQACGQPDRRAGEIADGNPLQHAEDAPRREVEPRKTIEEQAQARTGWPRGAGPVEEIGAALLPRPAGAERTSVNDSPTIHRNDGNTTSVGVHPCQSACCSGP